MVHAGKVEYKPEFASLTFVLEHMVKEAAATLALKGQRVVLDLEQNITMNLDPMLISGVAKELLTNAIDFSPDKSSITVRSRRLGKYAEFSVIDHGCGIPKRDLHRMFEEFRRGGNASKFKADGNGLGLYIVKGIVEEANGHVFITSEEGKGTTVTVRLPIV
jgi:two-component system sensor histidine kinase VicK